MFCIITLGRVVRGSRKSRGISQKELCEQFGIFIDFVELCKIENDRIDIRSSEYDWFILAIAEIFELNIEWLELIRQQTEPQPVELSQGIFPVYYETKN